MLVWYACEVEAHVLMTQIYEALNPIIQNIAVNIYCIHIAELWISRYWCQLVCTSV